jgi:hypothetical protein
VSAVNEKYALDGIVMYGMLANLFFLACEVFVVFYSGIPEHTAHFIYLYQGSDGKDGLVSGGFIPSPLHRITEYAPTLPELMISTGVYAIGLLCLTILLKMAVHVKNETGEQVAFPQPRSLTRSMR